MITLSSQAKDGDDWANRVAAQLVAEINQSFKTPLRDAANVVDATLLVTDTNVYHGLSAIPKGWIVVGNNANAVVYEATRSTDPGKYLKLRASATATVKLLFF